MFIDYSLSVKCKTHLQLASLSEVANHLQKALRTQSAGEIALARLLQVGLDYPWFSLFTKPKPVTKRPNFLFVV